MKSKIISVNFLRSVPGKWGSFNVWNIGLENGVIAEYLYKGSDCNFSVGNAVEYTLKKKPGYVDEIKLVRDIHTRPIVTHYPQTIDIDQLSQSNETKLVQVKNSIEDRKWIYEQAVKIYTHGRDYSYGGDDILEIDKISKEILKWLNQS
jgi:hypothetical protein